MVPGEKIHGTPTVPPLLPTGLPVPMLIGQPNRLGVIPVDALPDSMSLTAPPAPPENVIPKCADFQAGH